MKIMVTAVDIDENEYFLGTVDGYIKHDKMWTRDTVEFVNNTQGKVMIKYLKMECPELSDNVSRSQVFNADAPTNKDKTCWTKPGGSHVFRWFKDCVFSVI